MRLPHRLQGQKVKSQGGAGAYCGGDLAAQLVESVLTAILFSCRPHWLTFDDLRYPRDQF